MEEYLYLKAKKLKESLNNDQRIIRLNELEKKMDENEEVMALAYQKDLAVSAYSDALNHFSNDSEEAKKSQHELHLKKEALDNHPLVREYLKAYAQVRDLYFQINDILFSELKLNLKERK